MNCPCCSDDLCLTYTPCIYIYIYIYVCVCVCEYISERGNSIRLGAGRCLFRLDQGLGDMCFDQIRGWAICVWIRLGDGRYVLRFPARAKVFALLRNIQNGSEVHLAAYSAGIEAPSPGLKQQSDTTEFFLVPRSRMRIATPLPPRRSSWPAREHFERIKRLFVLTL